MTKREKIAIISSIIYIGIMAVGMFVLKNVVGSNYESTDMVNTLIYFEIILTVFTFFIYKMYFRGVSFNKIEKLLFGSGTASLFTIMFLLLIGIGSIQFLTGIYANKNMKLLLMVIVTTLLVGISEELMFRGILLPALVEKRGKVLAVIFSSIAFGLLHSVNIFGGVLVKDMFTQLFATTLTGILFACIALEIKNIIPLIIYHWFWDAISMAGTYLEGKASGLMLLLLLIEFVFTIILFIILILKNKNVVDRV